jgi:hypothetical protein
MNEPNFNIVQLNPEGIKKSGEIAAGFTTLQRTINQVLGGSSEMHIINQKLQEAWALTNTALVATTKRVAA